MLAGAGPVDWPALTQKPHEAKSIPDPGLPPLLAGPGGEKVTTREGWEKARAALRDRWLGHLGTPPAKPAALDAQAGGAERLDGYTRRLVTFSAEGDDRVRAYLLVPDDIKKGERRPAVVVFHETTPDTFRQPAGLRRKPDLALAVHLARRGYVTLSPECALLRNPAGRADGKPIEWARAQALALAKWPPRVDGDGEDDVRRVAVRRLPGDPPGGGQGPTRVRRVLARGQGGGRGARGDGLTARERGPAGRPRPGVRRPV